jgi:hypothetical protein
MPAPLEGGRILHLVVAAPGWDAWFKAKTGVMSQPVACWGVIENEKADAKNMRIVARTQDVVPLVCGGAGGMIDATIPDEDLGDYIGTTGPGESNDRLMKLLALDEAEEAAEVEEIHPGVSALRRALKAVPNQPATISGESKAGSSMIGDAVASATLAPAIATPEIPPVHAHVPAHVHTDACDHAVVVSDVEGAPA